MMSFEKERVYAELKEEILGKFLEIYQRLANASLEDVGYYQGYHACLQSLLLHLGVSLEAQKNEILEQMKKK